MIRKAKEDLFEATFIVLKETTIAGRRFQTNEKFRYVSHVYDTDVEKDCEGNFPPNSASYVVFVDEQGNQFTALAHDVTEDIVNEFVDVTFPEKE